MKTSQAKPLPYTRSKDPVVILEHVMQAILDEPKRYNQVAWLEKPSDGIRNESAFPACGTIGCVAGWTCVVSGLRPTNGIAVEVKARKILGGDTGMLFSGGAVEGDPGTRVHAKNGVLHILNWMKEKFDYDPKPALLKRLK